MNKLFTSVFASCFCLVFWCGNAMSQASFTYTNTQACEKQTVTLKALPDSGKTYAWDFGADGTFESTILGSQYVSYFSDTAGTINVKLLIIYNSGAKDSVTSPLTINPLPVSDFYVSDVCRPNATVLWDSSSISSGSIVYHGWDLNNDGNINDTSSSGQVSFNYGTAGTYQAALTVVSDMGCTSKTSKSILLYEKPTSLFSVAELETEHGTDFTDQSYINIGTVDLYIWDFGDGNTSLLQNPTNIYAEPGTYNVTFVTVSNNYCSDTLVEPVVIAEHIDGPSSTIEVKSNVITPNNDGYNDVLDFGLTGCEVTVYNRWNDQVYTSSSYNNDWSDSGLDAGAYYYKIKCPSGVEKMGVINIIK